MNCNEPESGKSQATNTDTTIPKEVVIPVDQIEIIDADRLREDDDPKTISEYRETYLMCKNDDGSFNDPFPPCGGFINESGKFAVTAGRHRIIAGREVGVKEFRCIVFSDKESAIWHGLGDNCKNRMNVSFFHASSQKVPCQLVLSVTIRPMIVDRQRMKQ